MMKNLNGRAHNACYHPYYQQQLQQQRHQQQLQDQQLQQQQQQQQLQHGDRSNGRNVPNAKLFKPATATTTTATIQQ